MTEERVEIGGIELEPEQATAAQNLVDNEQNVSLMAGAGTGKTTTLTACYIHILETELETIEDPDEAAQLPEQILTTTFTERAADDLKRKVRGVINARLTATDDETEYRKWRAVADAIDTGYVHTIHGFCNRLLEENALDVPGLEPGFEVVDETETAQLVEETARLVLEENDAAPYMEVLATRFSRQQLTTIVRDLLAKRFKTEQWAHHFQSLSEQDYLEQLLTHHPLDPVDVEDQLDSLTESFRAIHRFRETPPADIDTSKSTWESMVLPLAELIPDLDRDNQSSRSTHEQLQLYVDICDQLTSGSGNYYSGRQRWRAIGPNAWQNSTSERYTNYKVAIETLETELDPAAAELDANILNDVRNYPYLDALADLTETALTNYQERKQERDLLDFNDLISYTLDYLETLDEDARQEVREQFSYVMVDEFQDTNDRQWQLVRALTSATLEQFDADHVFVVGDVKQSIYRFRDADVTIFTHAESELAAANMSRGEPADQPPLRVNFRTLPTPLTAINGLFDTIFEAESEAYEPAPQALVPWRSNHDDIEPIVEYLPVPDGDPEFRETLLGDHQLATRRAASTGELEARALVARITDLLNGDTEVYEEIPEADREPDGPRDRARPIEPSDVAILLRARSHLKEYERALRAAEIPYTVIKGTGFFETTEVRHLLNLFRVLVDPEDDRALYGVLRSPLFGLTDETLAPFAAGGDLWEALTASTDADIEGVVADLQRWRTYAGTAPETDGPTVASWGDLLTHIIDETGYLAAVAADERGTQAVPNIDKFRDRLWALSDDGVTSLQEVVRRIEAQVDQSTPDPEASEAGETDGVQVLTVHEAKGQEYPVVAVPGVGRKFNPGSSIGNGKLELEQLGDETILGLKGPASENGFEMEQTVLRERTKVQRQQEERAEEKRILYVACSRAQDHLLLSGTHDRASQRSDRDDWAIPVAEPEPDEASAWRDWLQPLLFGQENPHEAWCTLRDTGTLPCHLEYTRPDRTGDMVTEQGEFTVRLPPEFTRYTPDTESASKDPVTALSPDPDMPAVKFRLSATELASFLGGYGELQLDASTQTVYVEEIGEEDTETSPDTRHGEEEETAHIGDPEQSDDDTANETDEVDATVFGEMVHRLCELRPPKSNWDDVMEQTLDEKDATAELTPEIRKQVETHAQRGIQYVDTQSATVEVEHQYDELYVTADFEHGEIAGYIDHLIVTPEVYHIIDYKTGDVTSDEMEEDAEYYFNQMKAYAIALHQQRTGRDIRVSLVFTHLDDVAEVEWPANTVETLKDEIQETLSVSERFH